ncbi:MAG: hypothetical protein ACTTKF_05530 [Bacteroides sp.]
MKLQSLWILGAMALMASVTCVSCSKDEVKKTVSEAVEMDMANVTKTWKGKYYSLNDALESDDIVPNGEIVIKGNKKELTIDTKDVKGIKVTVTTNTLAVFKGDVVKDEALGIESGELAITSSAKFPLLLKVVMKESSKSFLFKGKKE